MLTGGTTATESGNPFSFLYRFLHQGFAILMMVYLVTQDIIVTLPVGFLFYTIAVPTVCIYHAAGTWGGWPGTSGYAATLFGTAIFSWMFFSWRGNELGASVFGTIFVVAGLAAIGVKLLPHLQQN